MERKSWLIKEIWLLCKEFYSILFRFLYICTEIINNATELGLLPKYSYNRKSDFFHMVQFRANLAKNSVQQSEMGL